MKPLMQGDRRRAQDPPAPRSFPSCFLTLVAALVLTAVGEAVSSDDPPRPEAAILTAPMVEIPLDLSTGRPVVELLVNGRGPYDFILDTGAGASVIDTELASELELPLVGETGLGDPTDPEAIPSTLVRAESLESGGLMLRGVTLATLGLRGMMGEQHGGILGVPDLGELLATLDYPRGLLVLRRGELPADDPDVFPYEPYEGIVSLPLSVNGEPLTAHLDSGSPGGFTLPRSLAERWEYITEPVEIGKAGTVNNLMTIWGAELDGTIEFAGLAYENPRITLTDLLGSWANIGSEVLRELVVDIDQRNHRLRMRRAALSPPPPPQRRRVGVMFQGMARGVEGLPVKDGGLEVNMVVPGSLAEGAGIKIGDTILSINGRSIEDYSLDELSRLFGGAQPLHLEIQRGRETLEASIE